MDPVTARVEPEILDALQTLQPVPIGEFRLRSDCEICVFFIGQPATHDLNQAIRGHILIDHRDLVIVTSD